MRREDLSKGRYFRLGGRRGHIDMSAGATTAIQITVGVLLIVRKFTGVFALRMDNGQAGSNPEVRVTEQTGISRIHQPFECLPVLPAGVLRCPPDSTVFNNSTEYG